MLGTITFSATTVLADSVPPDPVVQLFTVAADVTKLISNIVKLKNDPLPQKAGDVVAIISNLMALSRDSKGIGNAFQHYPAVAKTFFDTLDLFRNSFTKIPII